MEEEDAVPGVVPASPEHITRVSEVMITATMSTPKDEWKEVPMESSIEKSKSGRWKILDPSSPITRRANKDATNQSASFLFGRGNPKTLLNRYYAKKQQPCDHFLVRAKTMPQEPDSVTVVGGTGSCTLEDRQRSPPSCAASCATSSANPADGVDAAKVPRGQSWSDVEPNDNTQYSSAHYSNGSDQEKESAGSLLKRWSQSLSSFNSLMEAYQNEAGGEPAQKPGGQYIVNRGWFTVVVIIVVVLHSLFLAIDTDVDLGSGPTSTAFVVDATFTAVYIIEMVLRLSAAKLRYFNNRWNLLDVLLIALSVVDLVVVATTLSSDPSLSVMVTFRMMRLLRLVRMVRLFRFCKELWILACGIATSMKTVFWAWLLIGMIIYIFSLCFARILSPFTCALHDSVAGGFSDDESELFEYFGTVPKALFSVFQCVTLEDWPAVAEVAARHEMWVGPLFILLLMLSTYGVMHVIVAVFVNSALEASMVRSKDLAKKAKDEQMESCKRLCEVFKQADADGKGRLTQAEFIKVLKMPGIVNRLNSVGVDSHSAAALFDILDLDGSQTLCGMEFVEGVLRSRGTAQNKDMIGMRCDIWRVNIKMEKDIERATEFIQARVQHTLDRVDALRQEAAPVLKLAMKRLSSGEQPPL